MIKSAKDYEIWFSVRQTISHGQRRKVQDKSTKPSRPTQDKTLFMLLPSFEKGHIALIIGDNFGGVFVTALQPARKNPREGKV